MPSEKETVYAFLKKHEMLAENVDFMRCVDDFVGEMAAGLAGESSLPMHPTHLSVKDVALKNERVIVIDAGGTNFRRALVSFDENGVMEITDYAKHRMPGTTEEIDADEFFRQIAALVAPIADKSDRIGFCFSYPLEMTKDRDGIIHRFTKELKVRGAEGRLVGKSLLEALGAGGKKITILNDTVAALLGGIAEYNQRSFSSYIGFILGTGTNTAYIEESANITKDDDIRTLDGNMIINMESGNFGASPNGDIDDALARSTKKPEEQRFEKKISGAYLGMNLLFTLRTAAEEGLFSDGFLDKIKAVEAIESIELHHFFQEPYGAGLLASLCEDDSQRKLIYYFAEEISERAAKLAAINLAATVKKSGCGENPLAPVCIVAEGSTYYKAKFIADRVAHYLKKYLNDEMQLYCEIVAVDNATLVGSAMAGLLS